MTEEKWYEDALEARMHNRRIALIMMKDGWGIHCKRLGEGREVVETTIKLTHEAMKNLVVMYHKMGG